MVFTPLVSDPDGEHDDPAVRKHVAAIDRVLVTFEQIDTWPDNIAFLNRLLKTIQSSPTLPIFRKREIATCLALCLLPRLPAGVQQKALEVYSYIFSSSKSINNDMAIFLTGLTPLLGYASTKVKDTYIAMLSTFVVAIGFELGKYMTSLVLSLLPALEDEQDESFAACFKLMNDLRRTLEHKDQFWDAFWYASLSIKGTQRAGTLTYASHYFMEKGSLEPQSFQNPSLLHECIGSNPAYCVKAITAGLKDENVLIQRGFLELLVVHGSLSQAPLSSLAKPLRMDLLYAGVQLVLKKDVGLNRRLWTWLSGTTLDMKSQSKFSDFVAGDLAEALLLAISSDLVKVNKVTLSLLDWDDIGAEMIVKIFPSIIKTTKQAQDTLEYPEILLSTRAVVEAIPFDTICTYLQTLCDSRDFVTAQFMMDTFEFEVEQIPKSLPELFLSLLNSSQDERPALVYANTLSHFFNESALQIRCTYKESFSGGDLPTLLNDEEQQQTTEPLGVVWLVACFNALLKAQLNCDVLHQIVHRRLELGSIQHKSCLQAISFVENLLNLHDSNLLPFEHLEGVVFLLPYLAGQCDGQIRRQLQHLCLRVARQCWHFLGSSKLKYEIASVACLSKLAGIIPVNDFEAFFSVLVADELHTDNPIEKFAAIWTHYHAKSPKHKLLRTSSILVLDSLAFGNRLQQSYICRWMHASLPTLNHLLHVVLEPLYEAIPLHSEVLTVFSLACSVRLVPMNRDLARTTYFLELLCKCLSKLSTEALLSMLQRFHIGDFGIESSTVQQLILGAAETSDIFFGAACGALELDLQDNPMTRGLYEHCIEIGTLISRVTASKLDVLELVLMHKLNLAIFRKQFVLQQVLVDHLIAICPDTAISSDSEKLLLSILSQGLAGSRQHPVLQDYLRYCSARIDLNDKRNLGIILQLTDCVIEQLNFNLIDIDAVLNTENFQDTTTAHENVMLLLQALKNLALPLAQAMDSTDQDALAGQQTHSFLNGVLFTKFNNEHESKVQTNSSSSVPLNSIIEATANVWLWAYRNGTSVSVATSYTAEKFLAQSYELMKDLSRTQFMSDTLQVLLASWVEASGENRLAIQILCRKLFEEELLGATCRILKASLSFQQSQHRKVREQHAYRNILYLSVMLRNVEEREIMTALPDITAVMRHFPLHLPLSEEFDVILLEVATSLCANITRIGLDSVKKTRREITDILVRIYTSVTTHHTVMDRNSALALSLCKRIPYLPEALQDAEKTTTLLNSIVTNTIQPGMKLDASRLVLLSLFREIVELPNFRKVWRRNVNDSFYEESFFAIPSPQGAMWAPIIKRWILGEKEKFSDLLAKPNNTTPGHLFISSTTEQLHRILQIKRLTFVEIALPIDSMSDKTSTLVVRLQDAAQDSDVSFAASLVLMQSIMLRTSQVHLRDHIMQFVLTLQKSFLQLVETTRTSNMNDVLLYTTLRTLDIMLYLGLEEFQLHIWTFIEHNIQDDQIGIQVDGETLSSCLVRTLGPDYIGPPFSTLLRAPDALEMHIGDYLRNVGLLYRDWILTNSSRPKDYNRIETEILSQLFVS